LTINHFRANLEVVNAGLYGEGPGTLSNIENALLSEIFYWECTGSIAVPRNIVDIFDIDERHNSGSGGYKHV
jgi:hypothetical protein